MTTLGLDLRPGRCSHGYDTATQGALEREPSSDVAGRNADKTSRIYAWVGAR